MAAGVTAATLTRTLTLLALLAARAAANPCDIYDAGGTPCVAAHSTTRALYAGYAGPLYQVVRARDHQTADINAVKAGGVADAAAQDGFCANATCLISIIYDQSPRKNHLTKAPPGAFKGPEPDGSDSLASATGAPVALGNQKAYGVFISPGHGYRNDKAAGTARGDEPQGMYAVLDGFHHNDQCCFDYGNAETSNTDTGNGHMEAIYYGTCKIWGRGAGQGPWVMADLENGLFSGRDAKFNEGNPTVQYRFVAAMVKGAPGRWAIRGGDAVSGGLSTYYSGARPRGGYDPMNKEGAIVLGIGGDNSNSGQGTLYEAAMTAGFPSDETENKVHADLVAAGYTAAVMSGSHPVGSRVSLQAAAGTVRHVMHNGSAVSANSVGFDSDAARQAATWVVRRGLMESAAKQGCVSLEAADSPGTYLRHAGFVMHADPSDGSDLFAGDATFCTVPSFNGQGMAVRSWSYPTRYIRHADNLMAIGMQGGGTYGWDDANNFGDDTSWLFTTGLAP